MAFGKIHLALLTVATIALAPCAPADTVELKEKAYVKGPEVCLGDVAKIESPNKQKLAGIELASAALPGDTRRLDAGLVKSRIENAGFDTEDLELTGARAVHAVTLHQEVNPDIVAESLHGYIESQMPWDPQDTEIDVTRPLQKIVVPDGELHFEWRPAPSYKYIGSGSFRLAVQVDGIVRKTMTCSATVEPYVETVVAKRDLVRGELISSRDITTEKRRLSSLDGATFTSCDELSGYVARTTVFPGQVITSRKVEPRTVVKRNQIVTVQTFAGGLMLQGRAKALSDACAGDLLVCQNIESKQQFQGIVRNDGIVIVQ